MVSDDVMILVVEDEALIADIVVSGLEDAGYAVVTARTAEDAIGILQQDNATLRAVITDVNLAPDKLTGWDVARRARTDRRPADRLHVGGKRP
jgi:CheY-like chemotaxis protein